MRRPNSRVLLPWVLAMALLTAVPAAAQSAAGKFQFVSGDLKVLSRDGAQHAPAKGHAVNEGDTIMSGTDGSAQILMSDGGVIAVRPDTRMRLDQFVYRGQQDGSERSFITLLQGGFRAITGAVGKRNKQNYRVTTATATIGIRGTDYEPFVVLADATQRADAPGTYLKVNHGAAVLETPKGLVQVNPNQAAFAPGPEAAPRLLPGIPDFYRPIPITEPGDGGQAAAPPSAGASDSQSASVTDSATLSSAEGVSPREQTTAEPKNATQPSETGSPAGGKVMFVAGDVRVIGTDGASRMAVKGMAVETGERVVTASGASAQVKMHDGAVVAVRPSSQVMFEPVDGKGKKQVRLVQGAVRVAAVDTKAEYEVKTPNASFKVHKSDQETLFVPLDSPEAQGASNAGTFQKVNFGSGEMKAGDKVVALERTDVGFVPVDGNAANATKLERVPASVEKAYGNTLPNKLDKAKIATAAQEPSKSGVAAQPAAGIAPIKGEKPLPVTSAVGAGAVNGTKTRALGSPAQANGTSAQAKLPGPASAAAKAPASPALQPALTLAPVASSGPAATPGTTEFQIVGNKSKPETDKIKVVVPKEKKEKKEK